MFSIDYEYRKGIFFLRLIGELNKENYLANQIKLEELLTINKFKYIVINTNYLQKVDLPGLNYFIKICVLSQTNNDRLVICDKSKIFAKLFNQNIPNIKDELEVL